MKLELGKVPNDLLKEIVLDKLKHVRDEIVLKPGIGEDCAAIDFSGKLCVISSDPITGATKDLGRLAVHVSCNDVASCGAAPLGILVTILAPRGTTIEEIDLLMKDLTDTAFGLNVEIIGGHTEVTEAVNRMVVVTTVVGMIPKDKLVTSSGARVSDSIILTKSAGLEGTSIIASEREGELTEKFGVDFVTRAKAYIDDISTVKEGVIGGEFGVNAMHDVTEGGVLGGLWEIAEASGKGIEIHGDLIPIEEETKTICHHFQIDPLKLISSGSMLMVTSRGRELLDVLKANNIKAAFIGTVTEGDRIMKYGHENVKIEPPKTDELFKIF